ncbi:esterase-like activity of phytase family protein [Sphaerothrix gracilis]|uniref:esterase-like activity of phytase family protein n=1 Tax=Sphaerothrix gracilis TaxID=3151835 RepID=UPI0031FCCA75
MGRLFQLIAVLLSFVGSFFLTSCSLPQVSAEDRLFLDLSLDYLGRYELPQQDFEGTTVGGLSAITYDVQRDRFYVLSDDRGNIAPPRFYTLRLDVPTAPTTTLGQIAIEQVTQLQDAAGKPYAPNQLDPEGLALSPRQSLFVVSEGDTADIPQLNEYDLDGGQLQTRFRLPERYLPEESAAKGVQNNLSFESLTINALPGSAAWVEPFRVFLATEGPLQQDLDADVAIAPKNRFLHYLIGQDQSTLISEHLYPLDMGPTGTLLTGLSELLTLDQGGHFLAMERSLGFKGFDIRLYQLSSGGATDISTVESLKGDVSGIQPIQKRLLLNLADLDVPLDNFEGMTLGPDLPGGDRSLILISDNNFEADQPTQVLAFRLKQ